MEFIKTRWSGEKTHAAETTYNSVAFNNSNVNHQPNPIIISTHSGHQSQISIIHEVRNPAVKTMTSPTDSFHSVVSNLNEKEGNVNLGYTGSAANMNNQNGGQSQLQRNQ